MIGKSWIYLCLHLDLLLLLSEIQFNTSHDLSWVSFDHQMFLRKQKVDLALVSSLYKSTQHHFAWIGCDATNTRQTPFKGTFQCSVRSVNQWDGCCWPYRSMEDSEGFRPSHDQGYGCRHTFLSPLPVENWNSPGAGWISFLLNFLLITLTTVRTQRMMDTSSANLSPMTRNLYPCIPPTEHTQISLYTYVFHQRGQSAKMLALQHSRKRLGFRVLCKATATAGTKNEKYQQTTHTNSFVSLNSHWKVMVCDAVEWWKITISN